MPNYVITESVGNRVEPVNSYADLEKHHPSSGREAGRDYQTINGELEEVRLNRTVPHVKKDFMIDPPTIPAPVSGVIHHLNDAYNTVQIRDNDGNVLAQSLHMARGSQPAEGTRIEYCQTMGRMGDVGSPGSVHAHVEAPAAVFERYINDITSGRIQSNGAAVSSPAVNANPMADGVLKRGEAGDAVKALQDGLNKAGIRDAQGQPLPVTGNFGEKTEAAVRQYQQQKGLEVDGKAGNDTLTALGLKPGQQQTPAPTQPTPAPTQSTPAPTQPTPAPTQSTPAPTQPTQPTQPTPAPTQSTPAPALTPAQPSPSLPADVQRAKSNVEGWHLGQTSAQFETSNRGPGFISTGQGDLGGKSYGIYQLSSTQGSLAEYVGQSAKYGAEFKGLTPASAAFDAKWKEVAQRDPQGFSTDQHTFIKKEFFDVQNDTLKGRGIDLSDRGRAVQDMMWSTSVQFRNLTPNVVANGLKDKFGEGYQLSSLTDQQIVGAVQDYKLKRNDSLFSGSPDLWPGLRDRAKNEKTELVALANDEQSLKKAGVNVPIDLNKGPSPNAAGGRNTGDPMADGVLKHGETGDAVKKLQEALNNAGIRDAQGQPLPTTGYFGDKTEAAVRKYQEQKVLEVDGKAGKDTLNALSVPAVDQRKSNMEDKPQTPAATPNTPTTPATATTTPPAPTATPNTPTTPATATTTPPATPAAPATAGNNHGHSHDHPATPPTATDKPQTTPNATDKPLISNPNHPDNKLYQQAVSNLEQLGPGGGFKSREDLEKAAAAVAADARQTKPPLTEIDHISKTTTPSGQTLLVATQGDPTSPASNRSYIDYGQATSQTIAQSTGMADAKSPATQVAAQPAPQTEQPQQEPAKIAVAGR